MYDGSIRIKTKIDNSEVSPAMTKLERSLEVAEKEADVLYQKFLRLSKQLRNMPSWKKNTQEYQSLADKVNRTEMAFEKAGNRATDYKNKIAALRLEEEKSETNDSDFGEKFEKGKKSAIKFGAALIGIRTIYSAVVKAGNAYLNSHEDTANKMSSIWTYLGEIAGPIIETIANGVLKLIGYINVFLKALTGIDFVKKANDNIKAINKQKKAQEALNKTTASFDEMNVLQDSSSTSSSSSSSDISEINIPELNPDIVKGIEYFAGALKDCWEWLKKNKDLVIALGIAIGGIFVVSKIVGFIASLNNVGTLLGSLSKLFIKTGEDGAKSFNNVSSGILIAVAGFILMVRNITDLITNWKSLDTQQKAIKIGFAALGTAAIALGAAMALGISTATLGVGAIIAIATTGAITLIALIDKFISEKDAINSVENATKNLKTAQDNLISSNEGYIEAIDKSEEAYKKLEEAQNRTGLSGQLLFEQVQNGSLDYANMTEAQREVYKAYLDNDTAQKELKISTNELQKAKEEETQAMWDNELALAAESNKYDEYKEKVVQAYKEGKISAEEARDLIEQSMSRMSDASQETFVEDIPSDIKEGLDPDKYQTTGQKISNWFGSLWEDIKDGASGLGKFFSSVFSLEEGSIGKSIVDSLATTFKKILNMIIDGLNKVIALPFNKVNSILNKIRNFEVLNIAPFRGFWGENPLPIPQIPKLAKGGVVNQATRAIIGEAGPERIIPLSEDADWIEKVSDSITSKSANQNQIINIYLPNGKLLAQYVINELKRNEFTTNGGVL